jgi:hypothetical protein
MNCDRVKKLLSEGQPLTGSAQDHLASCAGCRGMVQALAPPEAEPDTTRISEIQRLITASLKPVRPLPPDRKLVWSLLSLFTAFSLVAAVPVSYKGFHVLNGYQRFAYYGLIMLCAAGFSITSVQEMIPGSKHKASAKWTIVATILSLALLVSVLFHNFDLGRFVPLGIPCLRLGSVCAVVSGALSWFLFRKGFFASPVAASASVGFFAGLAGVAVLALHCPIENSAHILVWHLGAMVLGGLGGAVVGTLRR